MNIKNTFCGGLMVIALLSGASAFAAQVTITGHSNYRIGSGGEFNVRDANGDTLIGDPTARGYVINGGTTLGTASGTAMSPGGGTPNGFETFCVEFNEYISLGGTYDASISQGAVYGGVAGGIDHDSNAGTPNTDFISIGTAFLYSEFASGDGLTGYNYTPGDGRRASAGMLQQAIWYLEDEITLSAAQVLANTFIQAAISAHGAIGAGIGYLAGGAKLNNSGHADEYDVAVLNLGGVAPNQKQDQLILHATPEFSVPDGGLTLMLMGLGLGGLALMRRKLA